MGLPVWRQSSIPPWDRSEVEAAIERDLRKMVARELHDRVAQTLTGMLVELENFKSQEVEWGDVLRQLEGVQSSTREVLSSLRQLLHDLRGEEARHDDFVATLNAMITRFEDKTEIVAQLEVRPGWPSTLTPPASLNLYRIVEEALANVRMHSGARSVRVVLGPGSNEELVLNVDDDGRGVDTDSARPVGLGTIGMRERALILGGELRVESEPQRGTRVLAIFPKNQLVHAAESNVGLVDSATA